MQAFLVAQWRNIRQRKRRRVSIADKAELSQANSLYDESIGSDVAYDPTAPTFPEVEGHIVASQSQPARSQPTPTQICIGAEVDLNEDKSAGGESKSAGGDVELKPAPHSHLNDVKSAVKVVEPNFAGEAATQTDNSENLPPRAAAASTTNSDSDFEDSRLSIRLNLVAKKTGRPMLDKNKKAAEGQGKRVCYYDSLSSAHYKSALDDLAWLIVKDATPGYTAVGINAPIQFDGFSCGFFVCMKFWRCVDPSVSQDLTASAIDIRRAELLRFLLHGKSPSNSTNDAAQ
ncbi:hypothetical protein P43SY_008745 [Pythium insidiosum]|uniref:Ubiquitin-like protease family profile domain-containing protein n=1 Tax=Pythium insidiosum TaxID=114742 RepID=A0AAD5L6Y2_PYTIN|nr:hypothetical protein P43SY_008745 [Pythium insidiosum]